jgi:glucosamine-6-phosphate deaminase
MKLIIKNDYEAMSEWAANHIANAIRNHKEDRPFVLGLPTGSSPLGTYKRLIEMNKAGTVSFKNVVTFNMDEYVGLTREHDQSYWYFMHDNFFNHIDIPAENINILDGMAADPEAECARYNKLLETMVPDLQVLGIGSNGHIAFNEPGTPFDSVTHVVQLTESTIKDNSRLFADISQVPRSAFTMGLQNIMNSKIALVLANGANKAKAVAAMVHGEITEDVPASILQKHPNCILIVDAEAGALLPEAQA